MITMELYTFWIFVFVGITNGNHANRARTTGIGRVGNPLFSIDPFALSSLSSLGTSATTSSASGGARSIGGARGNQIVSRMIPSARRRGRPVLTQVQSRPVLVISNGGSINQRPRIFSRPIQLQGRDTQIVQTNTLLEILGIGPSSVGSRRTIGLSHQPPGVSFLGNQRLSGNHAQIILPQSVPILSNPILQSQTPVSQVGLVAGNQLSSVLPSASANPAPRTNTIPGLTGLTIGGVTPKGELIIQGPGGSITIGPELLTGIQRNNAFPLMTEFEEMEQEAGMRVPGAVKNSVRLTEPGRGSIVIAKGPKTSASSSATAGGAIASSSASSSSSSASSSSSSSSSASSSASISSSSATAGGLNEPSIAVGNGITVESGGSSGRVIRIGGNGAAEQVITMGGAGNGNKGGSGLHVPGNATFIVGG